MTKLVRDWKDYKLDNEEIELLESVENGEWKSIGNIEDRKQTLRNFFSGTNKEVNQVTLHLPKEDYESILNKSKLYGISYQELIQKLIHNFATDKILL